MKDWLNQFPRLSEIHQRSCQSHPENYFNGVSDIFSAGYGDLLKRLFGWIEVNLQHLDPVAWKQLAAKTLPYVCKKRPPRGWSQFWDHLYEALGYVLLAKRGYTKIRFIERESGQTPDLIGESESARALVEVKTVNCSAGDLHFRNAWPPVVCDVGYGLSEKFKGKLGRTIQRAALNQLQLYGEPTDKRILLLVIELDSSYKFIAKNYAEVNEFIATHQLHDVEVVHQIIH